MNNFWNQYPTVIKDMEYVENILRENMKCKEKSIEQALMDMINSGGKMLRPAFVILAGRFGDFNGEKLYPLAAVIEMLHMATLIHDDIIDNSELRRGVQTIQSKYGPKNAVFTGDLLFTRCFMLLSNDTSIENMKMISEVISRIFNGEIEQFSSQYCTDTTVKEYLRRISTKTAALFSLSLYIGAVESGCDEKLSKTLGRIGYEIGMAFQIIDDILDYVGQEDIVGKSLGNDLKHGIYTLPLIYAIKLDRERLAETLSDRNYDDETIKEIINLTVELGGLDAAKKLARRYTDRAFKRIDGLKDCESKRILFEVTERLLLRKY